MEERQGGWEDFKKADGPGGDPDCLVWMEAARDGRGKWRLREVEVRGARERRMRSRRVEGGGESGVPPSRLPGLLKNRKHVRLRPPSDERRGAGGGEEKREKG